MKKLFLISFLIFTIQATAQKNKEASLLQAKKAYEANDYTKALGIYDEIIEHDAKNMEAYFLRGWIKMMLNNYDGAIVDFSVVLNDNPYHYGALANRAYAYLQKKQYQAALNDCEQAQKTYSGDNILFLNKGAAYCGMLKFEEGIEAYTKSITLNPEDMRSFQQRALAYMDSGNPELGMMDLETILLKNPGDSLATLNTGYCYIRMNKFKEADMVYQKLYNQWYHGSTSDFYILNNWGYVKYKLGKKDEGIAFIQKSLEINPENSYAYKYLAEIYLNEGNKEASCKAVDKGIELGFTTRYGKELEVMKAAQCR